ncbi:MAG TPA: alpha/beta fold hydrolase [Solirubrobacteraceae bacterium]|nr:alpha/beta fold hydrolase [Solirubrobacteraceae bacterium]
MAPAQESGPGEDGGRRATVSVPLDHANPGGARIDVAYARFPARGARRGTIVFLAGGPGEPAVGSAGEIATDLLRPLWDRYEIVVVDQRGAGRSSPLRCPSLRRLDDASVTETAAAVARCGQLLGARRRLYSTYETVLDLEDVRAAIGRERIIPLGVSYGAQVAGEYARRFPQSTAAVILDSASPVEGLDVLGRLPQLALPRVLDEICFIPGCASILGSPRDMLERAVELLDRRPLRGLDPGDLYSLLRASDLDPLLRAELPAALQAATRRDAAPLLRLVRYVGGGGGSGGVNQARFLATTCIEGQLPWPSDSDPTGRPALLAKALDEAAASYAPFPVEAVMPKIAATACLGWPGTPRPPFPPSINPGPDVPVLVLAGREDLRTPLEDQRRLAAQFPAAQVLPVPGVGHSVLGSDLSGCAMRGVRRFLAGLPRETCAGRTRFFDIALPAARSLAAVPRPRGDVPAVIGRTAVAVDLTLRDAERWATAAALSDVRRIPGLRGGRLRFDRVSNVRLERYEVVGGVRVSGVLREGADTLIVTGSGATGTLTVRRGLVRGVLDGKRIVYRPLAARPRAGAATMAVYERSG